MYDEDIPQHQYFFHACIRQVTWNMFTKMNTRLLVRCVPILKFALTFTRLNMLNSYSEDLIFFRYFHFLQMKLLFCYQNNLKTLMLLQRLNWILSETKESEGLFPMIQKSGKSTLLLNSLNSWLQWPKSRSIVLKKKLVKDNEFFQSFEWIT